MIGIIGKKLGMTSVFLEDGTCTACTIIEAGPCAVTQVKTIEKDGYNAVQLGFDDAKEKNTSAGLKGHFKKTNTVPKRKLIELRDFDQVQAAGDNITVDIFNVGDIVTVIGTAKGKG